MNRLYNNQLPASTIVHRYYSSSLNLTILRNSYFVGNSQDVDLLINSSYLQCFNCAAHIFFLSR